MPIAEPDSSKGAISQNFEGSIRSGRGRLGGANDESVIFDVDRGDAEDINGFRHILRRINLLAARVIVHSRISSPLL